MRWNSSSAKPYTNISNAEGFIIILVKEDYRLSGKIRANYLDEDIQPDKRSIARSYTNEYLVTDLKLLQAIYKMNPSLTTHELYYLYLDSKYPTYTYH